MTACDDEAMSESDKAVLEALSTRSRDALQSCVAAYSRHVPMTAFARIVLTMGLADGT